MPSQAVADESIAAGEDEQEQYEEEQDEDLVTTTFFFIEMSSKYDQRQERAECQRRQHDSRLMIKYGLCIHWLALFFVCVVSNTSDAEGTRTNSAVHSQTELREK